MHNERCTSGSEGERQKPTAATPHGADARPYSRPARSGWLAIPRARGFATLLDVELFFL
jgi:hypothetical protein